VSLAGKLARLEVLVAGRVEDATPIYWTPERDALWRSWVGRILATMPEGAARRAVDELTTTEQAEHGPVARRLAHMAYLGVEGLYDGGYFYGGRVVALPAEVCAVLEAHPDAAWTRDVSCEDCGLETPHRSSTGWAAHRDRLLAGGRAPGPGDVALMTSCPLCGGRVLGNGFTSKKTREAGRRQAARPAMP